MRKIWLISANSIKSSESFSKQPIQLIVKLNSSLRHINVKQDLKYLMNSCRKTNIHVDIYEVIGVLTELVTTLGRDFFQIKSKLFSIVWT